MGFLRMLITADGKWEREDPGRRPRKEKRDKQNHKLYVAEALYARRSSLFTGEWRVL